jgi:hypothetical protein
MKSRLFINRLVRAQSLWQATKHEHNASPVGSAQANAPEVFSVEPEDFPAAKHMCESSVDRESKCPISSRQHYCKGLDGFLVPPDELRLSGLIGGRNLTIVLVALASVSPI